MAAARSVSRQPGPHAVHRCCAFAGHAKSCATQGTGMVGGSHRPDIFASAAFCKRLRHSELACRPGAAWLLDLFPTAVLYANGPRVTAEGTTGNSVVVALGFL